MKAFLALAILCGSLVEPAASQNIAFSLGRINQERDWDRHAFFPSVEVAFRIASFTPQKHPLRLAIHWGSWRGRVADGRCQSYCPPTPTPSDSHYRSHVVGLRLVHTTSTSQIQPRLLVGYSLRLSTAGEPVSMVDIGAGLGVRINPRTLVLGSVVRYQPLGRAGWSLARQYALRAGVAIGDF